MTGRARSRQALILSHGSVLVTLLAFHHRMRPEQWKPVEVLFDRLNRYIPTQDGVALGAVGAELTSMNISMAVRAVLAHIGEDRLYVALRAVHFFVHAAKGISRGVVIEFRDGADRAPTRARVAILAGDGKRAVRIPSKLPLSGGLGSEGEC
jgi:hypothetical protein